jgi:PAS domain S-box-containing protein
MVCPPGAASVAPTGVKSRVRPDDIESEVMSSRKDRRLKGRAPARVRRGGRLAPLGAPRRRSAPDRFFRDVVASMRNGVVAITRDGRIAFINDLACRTLGCCVPRAALGRPFFEVLRDSPDVVRVLASAFDLTTLPNRAELRLKRSGKVIGYTLSHVRDARGRVTGAALFFKDLTRVEQLEERERLRDRLAALGEMAAAIAHEVKNPLAGIEVMAGLLKRQVPDSADAQSLLNDIIEEAKMANAIVLEVLDFVRPIRLQVERVVLAEVLQSAIAMAETKAPRGAVEVTCDAPADLPPLQADPYQLRQLFTNLITNAFEALGGRGRVAITASPIPGDDEGVSVDGHGTVPGVVVEVADDGPGIPRELLDKVFNPFFTTKPQGSGLGLAIVRKIVDAHDGRIDVECDVPRGTRFRVTLPLGGGHLFE